MIALNNITFEFGDRALYKDASWHIHPNERIGLVGLNGTGKSTLLRVITGEYRVSSGNISRQNGLKIGFFNQDLLSFETEDSIKNVAMSAYEEALKLKARLDDLLVKVEHDHSDEIIHELSDVQHEFEVAGGYEMEYKTEELLEGLGFKTWQLDKPYKEFSGGWRMRAMLAKLILQQPDLLLLDEPTNHLDLPSIEWIEEYLRSFKGSIIIVSHDRYFLDRLITKTVEIAGRKITQYSGNYSYYLEEKAQRNELQRNQYENQQQIIRQTQRTIDRFKAKASKASMAKSKEKMLEKMELVDEVEDDAPVVNIQFRFTQKSGKTVCRLNDISKSYGNNVIIEHANGEILNGDKIALIGANGLGKSTLLRIIAGTETSEGEVTTGHNVLPSFFAQHQLEALNVQNEILHELAINSPTRTDNEIRTILGCFLFTGDDVFKKIKVLSGGEKSRVALAKTILSDANFLLLDEPTNHLDMQSVGVLVQALQQYEGTCIIVSHDRYFLKQVANKIWWIENRELKEYPGTYDEWEVWMAGRKLEMQELAKEKKALKVDKIVEEPQVKTTQGKELKQVRGVFEKTEARIKELKEACERMEEQMADDKLLKDHNALNDLKEKYERLKIELNTANDEFEKLFEKIMELEA